MTPLGHGESTFEPPITPLGGPKKKFGPYFGARSAPKFFSPFFPIVFGRGDGATPHNSISFFMVGVMGGVRKPLGAQKLPGFVGNADKTVF